MSAPVIELVIKGDGSGKVVAVACGACRRVAHDTIAAERCCRPAECDLCSAKVLRPWTRCETCRRSERDKKYARDVAQAFNKARKVKVEDYAHDTLCLQYWPEEADFVDVGDAHAWNETHPWFWGCTPVAWPQLDAEECVRSLLEGSEFPESAIDHLPDLNELQTLLDKWFERAAPPPFYLIDESTVVVFDPERTPETM